MENVRHEADVREHVKYRLTKISVAFTVIIASVQRWAGEIIFVVDKIIGYTVFDIRPHTAVKRSPPKRDREFGAQGHFVLVFFGNGTVHRQNYTHIYGAVCAFKRRR